MSQKQFLGLLTKSKDEPYVAEFINYYLHQGVDQIFIIDDDSCDKDQYQLYQNNDKIRIIYDKNVIAKNRINDLFAEIRQDFEWIIYVDLDEFVATKKNSDKTIADELKTTFKNCSCVKVPWVMMSSNNIEKNPDSLLKTNVYRWNHDLRHNNTACESQKFRCRYDQIEVKCIFRPEFFENIGIHHPVNAINEAKVVDGVYNKSQPLNPFHENLREKDIAVGYLLCYHYRIKSLENCLRKIKTDVYYKIFRLQDLLSSDYAEIIDETLKNKALAINSIM